MLFKARLRRREAAIGLMVSVSPSRESSWEADWTTGDWFDAENEGSAMTKACICSDSSWSAELEELSLSEASGDDDDGEEENSICSEMTNVSERQRTTKEIFFNILVRFVYQTVVLESKCRTELTMHQLSQLLYSASNESKKREKKEDWINWKRDMNDTHEDESEEENEEESEEEGGDDDHQPEIQHHRQSSIQLHSRRDSRKEIRKVKWLRKMLPPSQSFLSLFSLPFFFFVFLIIRLNFTLVISLQSLFSLSSSLCCFERQTQQTSLWSTFR